MNDELKEVAGDYEAVKDVYDKHGVELGRKGYEVLEGPDVTHVSRPTILHTLGGSSLGPGWNKTQDYDQLGLRRIKGMNDELREVAGDYEAVKAVYDKHGIPLGMSESQILEAQPGYEQLP